jgi:hypothetical protein
MDTDMGMMFYIISHNIHWDSIRGDTPQVEVG